jgi:hypothetical protein
LGWAERPGGPGGRRWVGLSTTGTPRHPSLNTLPLVRECLPGGGTTGGVLGYLSGGARSVAPTGASTRLRCAVRCGKRLMRWMTTSSATWGVLVPHGAAVPQQRTRRSSVRLTISVSVSRTGDSWGPRRPADPATAEGGFVPIPPGGRSPVPRLLHAVLVTMPRWSPCRAGHHAALVTMPPWSTATRPTTRQPRPQPHRTEHL